MNRVETPKITGPKAWLVALTALFTWSGQAEAAVGPDSIPPVVETKLSDAIVWTLPGSERPRHRGILLVSAGPDDPGGREYALAMHQWQFALIFVPLSYTGYDRIFKEAAGKSGHKEIENLPLVATTSRAYGAEFSNQIPDSRLIAFYCWQGSEVNKGGKDVLRIVTDYEVRGGAGVEEPKTAAAARGRGEPIAYAPIWGWTRGSFTARDFYWPLLDFAIRARLPAGPTPADGKVTLKPLDLSQGWVGNPDTWKGEWASISPEKDFKGDKSRTSWLPNEYYANLWRAYDANNTFNLTVPPREKNRVFAGFSVVGVKYGDHDVSAQVDNIKLMVDPGAVAKFPSETVAAAPAVPRRSGPYLNGGPGHGTLTLRTAVQALEIRSLSGRLVKRFGRLAAGADLGLNLPAPGVYEVRGLDDRGRALAPRKIVR